MSPGLLHTIFFHRYFPPHRPSSIDVLDLTLPVVKIPEIESLIDTRAGQLVRQLSTTSIPQSSVKGQLTVQFYEKKRRKAATLGWFTGGGKAEEEVCWETWKLDITLANPRTESERNKLMRSVNTTLQKTAVRIVTIVNKHKDHIPPITARDSNPFPYSISLSPRAETWGKSIGLF